MERNTKTTGDINPEHEEKLNNEPEPGTYGERLKQLRISKGFTLDEVYDKTGIWKGSMSLIENGKKKVSIELLHDLADMYGGFDKVVSYVLLNAESSS